MTAVTETVASAVATAADSVSLTAAALPEKAITAQHQKPLFAAGAAPVAAGVVADTTKPTIAALRAHDQNVQHQAPLFRLRRQLGSKDIDGLPATMAKKASLAGTTTSAAARFSSISAVDTRHDDIAGEVAAMVADEARSSPLNSPHHSREGDSRGRPIASSTATEEKEEEEEEEEEPESKKVTRSFEIISSRINDAASARGVVNCSGDDSTSAPAYEPSPYGEDNSAPLLLARVKQAIRQNNKADRLGSRYHDDESTPRAGIPISQTEHEINSRGDAHEACQEKGQLLSPGPEGQSTSPEASRDNFLSAMSVSDDACKRVREDLSRYMEGVRRRCVRDDAGPFNTKQSIRQVDTMPGNQVRREKRGVIQSLGQ